MTETATRRNRPYAARMAPEERREQLLDAVLQVIVEQGVHKVSMDSVAKQAGVTRPVVYGLFDDANQLLRASLDREERGALAQLADVLPAGPVNNPRAAITAVLNGYLRAVTEAPERWRAAYALVDSSTPTFRRRVERGQRFFIDSLERLVRSAGRGDDDTDVEVLARALYALIWQAGRLVLAEPDTFPAKRLTAFADRFVRTHFDDAG